MNFAWLVLRRFFGTDEGPLANSADHVVTMATLAMILKPIPGGWAVCLTDGHQLAQFLGPRARSRALSYVEKAIYRR